MPLESSETGEIERGSLFMRTVLFAGTIAFAGLVQCVEAGELFAAEADLHHLIRFLSANPSSIDVVISAVEGRETATESGRIPASLSETLRGLVDNHDPEAALAALGETATTEGYYMVAVPLLNERIGLLTNRLRKAQGRDPILVYWEVLHAQLAVPEIELLEIHYPSLEYDAEYISVDKPLVYLRWLTEKNVLTGDSAKGAEHWLRRISWLYKHCPGGPIQNDGFTDITGLLLNEDGPIPFELVVLAKRCEGLIGSGGYLSYLNGLNNLVATDFVSLRPTDIYAARTSAQGRFTVSEVPPGEYEFLIFSLARATIPVKKVKVNIERSSHFDSPTGRMRLDGSVKRVDLGCVKIEVERNASHSRTLADCAILDTQVFPQRDTVFAGQVLSADIRLRNLGNRALTIHDVKTSCACSTMMDDGKEAHLPSIIEPRGTLVWSLNIDTEASLGPGSKLKSFTLFCDDFLETIHTGSVRYKVVPRILLSPQHLMLYPAPEEGEISQTVSILTNQEASSARIARVTKEADANEADLHVKVSEDGLSFEVSVRNSALLKSRASAILRVYFADDAHPPVNYPLAILPQGSRYVRPNEIVLGKVKGGTPVARQLVFDSANFRPIEGALDYGSGDHIDHLQLSREVDNTYVLSFSIPLHTLGTGECEIRIRGEHSKSILLPVRWQIVGGE
jgi:hypothetical protein